MSNFNPVNGSMVLVKQKCYELLIQYPLCLFSSCVSFFLWPMWLLENTTILFFVGALVSVWQCNCLLRYSRSKQNFFHGNMLYIIFFVITIAYNMAYKPVRIETREDFLLEYSKLLDINNELKSLSDDTMTNYEYKIAEKNLRDIYNSILDYKNTDSVVIYSEYKMQQVKLADIYTKINNLKTTINRFLSIPNDDFFEALRISKTFSYTVGVLLGGDDVRYYFKLADGRQMYLDEYRDRIQNAERFVDSLHEIVYVEDIHNSRVQSMIFVLMILLFVAANAFSAYNRKRKFKRAFSNR